MNNINFNQPGGFPLSTNILDAMQEAYKLLNSFSAIAGENCILSGCENIGVNISDGVVVIGGELLPFKGSGLFLNAKVIIKQDIESKIFENSESKEVIYKRYAALSTAEGIPFASLARIKPLIDLARALVPKGFIGMYEGYANKVPEGWALCNGENGTPDLVDKFVLGAGSFSQVGQTGGLKEVTLSIAQMPEHSHTGVTNKKGEHKHEGYAAGPYTGLNIGGGFDGGNNSFKNRPFTTELSGDHVHELIIDQTGGSQAHENMPPYYKLAFIKFIG